MLKSANETICWLATHGGAVLVVGELIARAVAGRHAAEGVSMRAARSLLQHVPAWFDGDTEAKTGRKFLRLNAAGEHYHLKKLAERRKCSCRVKVV